MGTFKNNIIEWHRNVPLLNGTTVVIEQGNIGSGLTGARVKNYTYMTFSVLSEKSCTLLIDVDDSLTFVPLTTWITLPILAATYTTVYNLPAPLNANGKLVLNHLTLRFRLTETAISDHSYTHFYAKVWGE